MAQPPSLVIFDCDGVLVDTEHVANQLLVRVLAEDGFYVTQQESRRLFVGRSIESIVRHVEESIGRILRPDWASYVRDETLKAFAKGEIKAVPGVETVIRLLIDRGIPCCVASSGKLEKMRFTLGATNLLPLLKNVLFSAEQVTHGKPAPDLFLYAAHEMGHPPHACVVVEDSVPGVQAAVAAGMRVLGYAGDPHTDAQALKAAGAQVFQDMRELPALLGLYLYVAKTP